MLRARPYRKDDDIRKVQTTNCVFENNPNAYHCYHAVGFRETGEEEWYEMGDGKWKCIVMEIKSI